MIEIQLDGRPVSVAPGSPGNATVFPAFHWNPATVSDSPRTRPELSMPWATLLP